jgi:hypothetical protein
MRFHTALLMASGIALAALAAPLPADDKANPDTGKALTVRGRITRIQPDDGRVTLRTRQGKEVTLRVDDTSRLEMDGQAARLNQFKTGTRVRVTYDRKGGVDHVVSLTPTLLGSGEIKREVRDLLQSVRSYGYQHKDEYQKKMQAALRDLDERIEDLQDRADQAGGAAKKQFARDLEQLRQMRAAVREKLDKVKAASPAAFKELKAGTDDAYNDLLKAYDRARSQFNKK